MQSSCRHFSLLVPLLSIPMFSKMTYQLWGAVLLDFHHSLVAQLLISCNLHQGYLKREKIGSILGSHKLKWVKAWLNHWLVLLGLNVEQIPKIEQQPTSGKRFPECSDAPEKSGNRNREFRKSSADVPFGLWVISVGSRDIWRSISSIISDTPLLGIEERRREKRKTIVLWAIKFSVAVVHPNWAN